jgi:hypothetical protein
MPGCSTPTSPSASHRNWSSGCAWRQVPARVRRGHGVTLPGHLATGIGRALASALPTGGKLKIRGQPCSSGKFPAVSHLDDAVGLLLDSRASRPAPPFVHAPGTVVLGDDPQSRIVVSRPSPHSQRGIVQITADALSPFRRKHVQSDDLPAREIRIRASHYRPSWPAAAARDQRHCGWIRQALSPDSLQLGDRRRRAVRKVLPVCNGDSRLMERGDHPGVSTGNDRDVRHGETVYPAQEGVDPCVSWPRPAAAGQASARRASGLLPAKLLRLGKLAWPNRWRGIRGRRPSPDSWC